MFKKHAFDAFGRISAAALAVSAVFFALDPLPARSEPTEYHVYRLPGDMQREYGSLQYILTQRELEEFWALYSEGDRRHWIDEYWNLNDPVYTTANNEMLEEHNRRVALAESLYFVPKWPGWDQRGELIIRYGQPGFRTVMEAEDTPNGLLPPREIWYYGQHDMYVVLEDVYMSGEYTYTLGSVNGPSSIRDNKTSTPIAAPIQHFGDGIPSVPDLEAIHQYEQFGKMMDNFEVVRSDYPSSYPFNFRSGQIPFFYSVDCFRGGDAVDRVEVNVEFPVEANAYTGEPKDQTYVATAVFWDADLKEIGRKGQNLGIPAAIISRDSSRLMPAQLVFSLPPDFYHMAVTVEEKGSGRFYSYRTPVTCENFNSGLAISSVLFARKISETSRISPFSRGPLEVIPHAARQYKEGQAIPVYFEIYNVEVDRRGFSSYTVEYRVMPRAAKSGLLSTLLTDKKPLEVSSSFQASNYGPHDTVRLTIRTDNLWAGVFDFLVTITDDQTLEQVTRETFFQVVE